METVKYCSGVHFFFVTNPSKVMGTPCHDVDSTAVADVHSIDESDMVSQDNRLGLLACYFSEGADPSIYTVMTFLFGRNQLIHVLAIASCLLSHCLGSDCCVSQQ